MTSMQTPLDSRLVMDLATAQNATYLPSINQSIKSSGAFTVCFKSLSICTVERWPSNWVLKHLVEYEQINRMPENGWESILLASAVTSSINTREPRPPVPSWKQFSSLKSLSRLLFFFCWLTSRLLIFSKRVTKAWKRASTLSDACSISISFCSTVTSAKFNYCKTGTRVCETMRVGCARALCPRCHMRRSSSSTLRTKVTI